MPPSQLKPSRDCVIAYRSTPICVSMRALSSPPTPLQLNRQSKEVYIFLTFSLAHASFSSRYTKFWVWLSPVFVTLFRIILFKSTSIYRSLALTPPGYTHPTIKGCRGYPSCFCILVRHPRVRPMHASLLNTQIMRHCLGYLWLACMDAFARTGLYFTRAAQRRYSTFPARYPLLYSNYIPAVARYSCLQPTFLQSWRETMIRIWTVYSV